MPPLLYSEITKIIAIPGAYCIKLLPDNNSGYFNQSFFPVVKSMVNIMLTWVFLREKFYAMGPRSIPVGTYYASRNLHSTCLLMTAVYIIFL